MYKKKFELLKEFVSTDGLRPEISNPGLNETGNQKRIYATDGCIAFGFDFDDANDEVMKAFDKSGIKLSKQFPDVWKIESRALSAKNIDILIEKKSIKGKLQDIPKITLYPDCEMCDGNGEHKCKCGNLHGCKKCDESGEDKKLDPIGSEYELTHYVVFGKKNILFNPKYIEKIYLAANVLRSEIKWRSAYSLKENLFEIADCRIILMPVSCTNESIIKHEVELQ